MPSPSPSWYTLASERSATFRVNSADVGVPDTVSETGRVVGDRSTVVLDSLCNIRSMRGISLCRPLCRSAVVLATTDGASCITRRDASRSCVVLCESPPSLRDVEVSREDVVVSDVPDVDTSVESGPEDVEPDPEEVESDEEESVSGDDINAADVNEYPEEAAVRPELFVESTR